MGEKIAGNDTRMKDGVPTWSCFQDVCRPPWPSRPLEPRWHPSPCATSSRRFGMRSWRSSTDGLMRRSAPLDVLRLRRLRTPTTAEEAALWRSFGEKFEATSGRHRQVPRRALR
eukprot:11315490-Heterocapsa_arctica.AAC.1